MLLIKDTECIKCHNIEDVFAESEQVCNQQNSPIKQRLTKEMTFAILEKNFHEKKKQLSLPPLFENNFRAYSFMEQKSHFWALFFMIWDDI